MWPELKSEIGIERASLNRLLDMHAELLDRCVAVPPTVIEVSALSAMLHSFYTGIENLFKRVAIHLDHGLATGDMWHSRLLNAVAGSTPNRPAVISEELRDHLHGYLSFRHVFRHAYGFEIRWSKMAPLVMEARPTLKRLEDEVDVFIRAMDARQPPGHP